MSRQTEEQEPLAMDGNVGNEPRMSSSMMGITDDSQGDQTLRQIGALLKQTRESKGLSLDEAHRKCRIRAIHLSSLEKGDIDALPGQTFAVGFMRVYIRFLELDETSLMNRYMQALSQLNYGLATDFFPPPSTTSRTRPTPWLIIGAVVALVVFYGAYEWMAIKQETPQLAVPAPVASQSDAKQDEEKILTEHEALDQKEAEPIAEQAEPVQSTDEKKQNDSATAEVEKPQPSAIMQRLTAEKAERERQAAIAAKKVEMAKRTEQERQKAIAAKKAEMAKKAALAKQAERKRQAAMAAKKAQEQQARLAAPVLTKPKPKPVPEVKRATQQPEEKDFMANLANEVVFKPKALQKPATNTTGDIWSQQEAYNPLDGVVANEGATTQRPKVEKPVAHVAAAAPQYDVILLASRRVWMMITNRQGKVIRNLFINPGSQYEVPMKGGPYYAKIGDAGGISFMVKGERIPPLGRSGTVIRRLNLSPDALLARYKRERQ
uniref:Cytoskeleton protein RodZ-like C-terminal domain-containing protein n=1 Tax=Magnetococcus massalia (strain MO-1) TaxID=451514 RepID=A0A1S7LM22_MAGMO|nr:conserved protein of unknown function [Candidatus Magnetococcus massalia]